MNRKACLSMLDRLGCVTQSAEDGAQALVAATAADFDVILMDCQMPTMDGYQATVAIRGLLGERGAVPIVALTADALAQVRARCMATAMNDFITKPMSREVLAGALRANVRARAPATGSV